MLRCQAGDEAAFAELYRRFGPKTRRYLRGVLDEGPEDDVQQEVWLTVYRRVHTLTNPGGFRTWLFQVTRNRAVDALRGMRREREMLDRVEREDPGPDDTAERLDVDDEAIGAAMATLTAPHREVLLLRFWEDLSYPEIALVTGAPLGTVRSRLAHAKWRLRDALASPLIDANATQNDKETER